MGWLSGIGKLAKGISSSPLGRVASMVPGLGTVVQGVGLAATAYGAYKALVPSSGGAVPPMPFGGGGGAPMNGGIPTAALPPPGHTSGPGILPRGPGGHLQFPWNDPSVPADLKASALDDAYLRIAYRSPKGYVTIRDATGKPYPVLKSAAIKHKLWKAPHKPLLTGGEMNAIRRAERSIHKLQHAAKKIRFVQTAMHPHKHSAIEKAIAAKYKVLETKAIMGKK